MSTIYEETAKRLQCLIVNSHNKHETSAFTFQCTATEICKNDKCFWKQRDCYGLCPWVVLNNPEHDAKQCEVREQYGDPYFPKWEVCVLTNCLLCCCEDFKNGQDDS